MSGSLQDGAPGRTEADRNLQNGGVAVPAARAALPAVVLLAAVAGAHAHAGDAAAAPDEHAGQRVGSVLNDLIVSAPADENVLMDVPVSALSLSGEYLDDRAVLEPLDLTRVAPGMQVTEAAGFTLIYLRGVGADNFVLGDPSVAYYVDGIYFPFSSALAQEFGAVERVEVLKGPQGMLFGRSSPGGAVNVVTRRPRFDHASISIDGGSGTLGVSRGRLHGNLPLTERVALSLSALYSEDDYLRGSRVRQNANDPSAQGEPADSQTSRAGRLKLRVKATDDIDLTLAGYRYLSDGPGSHLQLNTAPSPLAAALGVEAQTDRTGAVDADPFLRVDTSVAYLGALWDLPWAHLRLLGSDQRITTAGAYDFDGSPQPLVEIGSDDFFSDSRSVELQLRSNELLAPDGLRWSAGVYYLRSDAGTNGSTNDISVVSNLGAGVLDLLPADQIPPALLNFIPSGTGLIFGRLEIDSLAFMTQATANLSDALALTLGARYQKEERRVPEAYNALEGADGEEIPVPYSPNPDELRKTTYSFDPKLSFEFRVDERLLFFLSCQEATKAGTFNPVKILLPVDYVEPEETREYELGFKTSTLGDRVNFSGALFLYRTKNLHTMYVSLLNGGTQTFESADRAQIHGVDFDLAATLLPGVVERLELNLGAAYLHARFTDFTDGAGYEPTTGLFTTDNDFTGNRIPRAPRFTSSASLSKAWALGHGALELGGDYYWNSGYFYTSQNASVAEQRGFDVLGAHAAYRHTPWDLRVALHGLNLLDETYSTGRMHTDFGSNVSLAPPRTWLLSVGCTF